MLKRAKRRRAARVQVAVGGIKKALPATLSMFPTPDEGAIIGVGRFDDWLKQTGGARAFN